MLAFAICLIGAGALLSFFARIPALVLVFVALGIMITAATVLNVAFDDTYSLPLTLVVAAVALQVGYGLAVVLRGVWAGHGGRERVRSERVAEGTASEATARTWSRSHDSGPLNHP